MTQATAERKQPDQRSLWFGMLTGPIVYSLHFVTVYLLVEAACRAGLLQFTMLGISGISFAVALLTVVILLTGLPAIFLVVCDWI
jgi:hypothetical protein